MNYSIETYISENKAIQVLVEKDARNAFLSIKEIATLFSIPRKTASDKLARLLKKQDNIKWRKFAINVGNRTLTIKHYPLEIVLILGNLIQSDEAEKIQRWFIKKTLYLDNEDQINNSDNSYTIIDYNEGSFSLGIAVSPREETVWLTQSQMAILFDVSKQTISFHIKNVLETKELDSSVVKENLTTGADGKNYLTYLYNLDMVISIGYRVNSKRGIAFRKWANTVLKSYLLKGYSFDEKRLFLIERALLATKNDIEDIKRQLESLRVMKIDGNGDVWLLHKGESFSIYSFLLFLISIAEHSICLIDPYADEKSLILLSRKKEGVMPTLVISKRGQLHGEEINSFKKQFGPITIKMDKDNHDRYLILDERICISFGSSFNSISMHESHAQAINNQTFVAELIRRAQSLPEVVL